MKTVIQSNVYPNVSQIKSEASRIDLEPIAESEHHMAISNTEDLAEKSADIADELHGPDNIPVTVSNNDK